MSKPRKSSIDYFPIDCNIFLSDDIADLMERYGPKGFTIYVAMKCVVYQNGYYVEMSVEQLARAIIRHIGNRHVTRQFVCEVIGFMSELGLLDDDLLHRNVVTSKEIQIHYEFVTRKYRRKPNIDKYWLLDDEESNYDFKKQNKEPLLSSAKKAEFSEDMNINSEDMGINYADYATKEKIRNYIYICKNIPDKLKDGLYRFIVLRLDKGKNYHEGDVDLLMDRLVYLSGDVEEQKQIIDRSIINGWTDFYPLPVMKVVQKSSKSAFHNFEQGDDVDYDELLPKVAQPLQPKEQKG